MTGDKLKDMAHLAGIEVQRKSGFGLNLRTQCCYCAHGDKQHAVIPCSLHERLKLSTPETVSHFTEGTQGSAARPAQPAPFKWVLLREAGPLTKPWICQSRLYAGDSNQTNNFLALKSCAISGQRALAGVALGNFHMYPRSDAKFSELHAAETGACPPRDRRARAGQARAARLQSACSLAAVGAAILWQNPQCTSS